MKRIKRKQGMEQITWREMVEDETMTDSPNGNIRFPLMGIWT